MVDAGFGGIGILQRTATISSGKEKLITFFVIGGDVKLGRIITESAGRTGGEFDFYLGVDTDGKRSGGFDRYARFGRSGSIIESISRKEGGWKE